MVGLWLRWVLGFDWGWFPWIFHFGVWSGLDLDGLQCNCIIFFPSFSCKPNKGWERNSKFCVCFRFKENIMHHCTPLVWWSLHKYKCLWGVRGKDRDSSLQEKTSHTYILKQAYIYIYIYIYIYWEVRTEIQVSKRKLYTRIYLNKHIYIYIYACLSIHV